MTDAVQRTRTPAWLVSDDYSTVRRLPVRHHLRTGGLSALPVRW